MERNETDGEVHLLWVGIVIESALIVVALVLAFWGLYDHQQPMNQWSSQSWLSVLGWGIVYTLPLLAFLMLLHFFRESWLKPVSEFCRTQLQPLFRGSTKAELFLLAAMAGLGEELLFRWCLQGGITSILEPSAGGPVSMVVGLLVASILFGLCHWVNSSYGVLATVVGVWFGLAMIFTGSWLVPALSHAVYDFIALMYVAGMDDAPNVID